MGKVDVYYRAFKNYRSETINVKECVKDRNLVKLANVENDKLSSTKYLCLIDEEWVNKIEEGLKYVQNAIEEGRQFIRTNSEVVPIEKVKRISRESVEHLAKHSDLITHLPDDPQDDLVPDQILMVEKLTDYAIYENRFLYLLLVYLVNFIDFRLDKIEKLRATYLGKFSIDKTIKTKGINYDVKISLTENRTNNPYPLIDSKADNLIRRVNDCKQIVNSLLNTELMTEVAKAPMIKPPITKTNVLKMNNNFKRSLALYEYVASYKGEGFTSQEVTREYHPFVEDKGDEIAEIVNLTEFISYKYGNEISSILETEYQREELRRKEEEAKRIVEQIRRLKKRVDESGKSMEEYMVMLENRNKVLESAEEELIKAKERIVELNETIDKLSKEKDSLNQEIIELNQKILSQEEEIAQLNEKYTTDMENLKTSHFNEVDALNKQREIDFNNVVLLHAGELDGLKSKHAADREALADEYKDRILALSKEVDNQVSLRAKTIEDYSRKLGIIVAGFDQKVAYLEKQLKECRDERTLMLYEFENKLKNMEANYNEMVETSRKAAQLEIDSVKAENKALKSYSTFVKGELTAIKVQQGILTPCDDFTSRERFKELEEEYVAFKSFFKAQWKKTNRSIRDSIKD